MMKLLHWKSSRHESAPTSGFSDSHFRPPTSHSWDSGALLYYSSNIEKTDKLPESKKWILLVWQDQENHRKGNGQFFLRERNGTAMLPLVKRRKQLSRIRNRNFVISKWKDMSQFWNWVIFETYVALIRNLKCFVEEKGKTIVRTDVAVKARKHRWRFLVKSIRNG